MDSNKWKLNAIDLARWSKNGLIFAAPVVLIYLASVSSALQAGFSWSAFTVTPVVLGAIALYVVNTLTDLFRKLIAGSPN